MTATKMAPKLPNTDWNAASASWPELRPSCVHTPEAQNGQRGDGADDDGIHKDLEDTELGLTDGVIRFGGAVTGDGGAHARLIGVHTAGGTPADRCHNGGAGEAAHSGVAGEGVLEDHADDSGELTHVGEDDDQRARHVQAGHHRDQNVGDAGHTLEAAGQNHAHQNGNE